MHGRNFKGSPNIKMKKLNLETEWEGLEEKGNFLCLTRWHISQVALLSQEIEEYI